MSACSAQKGILVTAPTPEQKQYIPPTSENDDPWPLQVDRVAIQSTLVECLRILAGHYGRRTSPASLMAGLPIPPPGITPALFIRAAERADLNARLVNRAIEALAIAPVLPCILVLEKGHSCILWEIRHPKKHPPGKN